MRFLILCLLSLSVGGFCTSAKHEEIFTKIYENASWGINKDGEAFSGTSSLIKNTEEYRSFLQTFLKEYEIESVVDLGCGDWEFSYLIDWSGLDYVGYDVVASVIEKDIERFSTPHISFVHANFMTENLPAADLMICKNVLQHFSNEDILAFLTLTKKFKYCLISNRLAPPSERSSFRTSASWDGVDLSSPPFNVKGVKALHYLVDGYVQEVFFIDNSSE